MVELAQLTPQQFGRFRDFIYGKCGIRIDDRKVNLLSNRLRRRLKAGKFADFDAYYRFIRSAQGAGELEHLLDAITTNETFFFRTEKHFEWLGAGFLDELIARHRAGERSATLRIWSAGCASGAEPYTIAICLAENMHRLRGWKIQILGTDISEEELRTAREGAYKSRAMQGVTAKRRQRYFDQEEADVWRVRPEIKKLVDFKSHNLIRPINEPAFDCVFIRNVLIYFDRESKQLVIDNLVRSLAGDGFLVVGPSEGVYDMLAPLSKISTFLYQKASKPQAGAGLGDGGASS